MNFIHRIFEATRFYRMILCCAMIVLAGVQLATLNWVMVIVDMAVAFLAYPEIFRDYPE